MACTRSAAADSALRGELLHIIASSPAAPHPVAGAAPAVPPRRLAARCVLFDLYGTLFSSASGDVGTSQSASDDAVFALALERAGFTLRGRSDATVARTKYFAEITRRHEAARRRGVDYPEVDIASVWQTVLQELDGRNILSLTRGVGSDATGDRMAMLAATWYEVLSNPVSPMPAMSSTIDALASAGILLGIVSNAQFYTPLLFPALLGVAHTDMGFRDDLCVWSYEEGRAKPSVELFSSLLKRLALHYGVVPEEVLYLGNDMLNDVWAAKTAGCRAALFAGDRRSLRLRRDDPRCADLLPDVVIVRLDDVLDMLTTVSPRSEKEG